MKVLAINSSPRSGKESYTIMMLNQLVEGMREAGADVEIVNLREKKIKYCLGCFSCWTKTPGQCIQKDDMTTELFPKLLVCDLAIYATPLYFHTINAMMSTFMERTLPAVFPFMVQGDDGRTFHPMRNKMPASILLTVCGFAEPEEFDPMLEFFKQTRHKDSNTIASICRPGASLLSSPFVKQKANDVLDATKQAGREVIRDMKIAPETMARVTQPLGNFQSFGKMANIYWKTCIKESLTPKEFDDKKMVPRPESLEEFMFIFPFGLNAKSIADRQVVLQFKFSGDMNESCYFRIDQGKIYAQPGTWEKPDLTIETPFNLWMDIMTKKVDGQQMFMEQKYKVEGDLMLMMQLFRNG